MNVIIKYICLQIDGTNHVPCCVEEGVPDICQDICRGEYSIPTDDIRTHVSCSAYTEQTLACIAEGIGTQEIIYTLLSLINCRLILLNTSKTNKQKFCQTLQKQCW